MLHPVDAAALGTVKSRRAIEGGELAGLKGGLGRSLKSTVSLRTPGSVVVGCFAARRAFDVAQRATSDVDLHMDEGVVSIRVLPKKDNQVGAGQLALLVAIPVWSAARPVCAVAEWLWFRAWLKRS